MSWIRPIRFALAGCGIALILLTLGGCQGCDDPIPKKRLEVHYRHNKTCRVWFDSDGPGNINPLLEFQIVSVKNTSKAGTPPVRFFLSKVFYPDGDTRHFEEPTLSPNYKDFTTRELAPGETVTFPLRLAGGVEVSGLFAITISETDEATLRQLVPLLQYDGSENEGVAFMIRDNDHPALYSENCDLR
jgi:hypothetical protein